MQVMKADPDKLENFSSMMIALDPKNPGFVRMTGFSQGDGFSSAVLMVDRDSSPEALNELFDLADKGKRPTGLKVSVVEGDAAITWIQSRLRDGREPHDELISAFIDEHLEPEQLDYLKSYHKTSLDGDMVNFLTTGEIQRRWDTLRFMPLGAPNLIEFADCVDAIDRGDMKSLQMGICRNMDWPIPAMKSVLKVEKLAASEMEANPDEMRRRLEFLSRTYRQIGNGYMEHINSSQFPKDIAGVEGVLRFDGRSRHWSVRTHLNEAPAHRFARRITHDMWAKAAEMLDNAMPENAGDYVSRMAVVLRSAVVSSRMQESAPDLMRRVERAANNLWNEQPNEKGDALALSSFLSAIKSANMSASRDMSSALGDFLTLKELRSNSERWHQQLGTLDSKVLGANECISWKPLFGSVRIGDNMRAVELTDTDAFERQGKLEAHCVATYSPRVLAVADDRATLIVSIEKKDGDNWKILSTAEIDAKIVEEGWGRNAKSHLNWSIPQHRAKYNHDPSPEAVKAASLLMGRLSEIPVKDMREYMVDMKVNGGELRRDLNAIVGGLRCNITMMDFAPQALAAAQNVLPKGLRGLDVDGLVKEFVAMPELDKRIFGITPHEAETWAKTTAARIAEIEDAPVKREEQEVEP